MIERSKHWRRASDIWFGPPRAPAPCGRQINRRSGRLPWVGVVVVVVVSAPPPQRGKIIRRLTAQPAKRRALHCLDLLGETGHKDTRPVQPLTCRAYIPHATEPACAAVSNSIPRCPPRRRLPPSVSSFPTPPCPTIIRLTACAQVHEVIGVSIHPASAQTNSRRRWLEWRQGLSQNLRRAPMAA